jgi:DNA-binding NtrC family response regulator
MLTGIAEVMVHKVTLVVDDEPSIRKYVSAILQLEHFQTVEAENGCDGLQIVCDLGNDLELVVSDIQMQMPNCDGLTFAHAVKEAFPSVPVILISGGAEPNTEGDAFVQKPFQPHALLEAIRNAVAHAAGTVVSDRRASLPATHPCGD